MSKLLRSRDGKIAGTNQQTDELFLVGPYLAVTKLGGSPVPNFFGRPNFVNWELNHWWHTYREEHNRFLHITYKGKRLYIPQVLEFDNTSKALPLDKFSFFCVQKDFKLPEKVLGFTEHAFAAFTKSLKYSNERNIRLIDVDEQEDKVVLSCQGVFYKDFLRSNLLLDAKDRHGNFETLRDYLHHDHALEPLLESPLGNNLGVNFLIFTKDDRLILQKRSTKVAFRKGEFCPSSSGTLTARDIGRNEEYISMNLLIGNLLRETEEELGIDDKNVYSPIFLGVTRELIRGGEPELFFFAKIHSTKQQILDKWKLAKDKEESKKIFFEPLRSAILDKKQFEAKDVQAFHHMVDELIASYLNKKASVPLITALALWKNYMLHQKTG